MSELDFDQGFPPVVAARAKLLILGSLPGRRSLEQRQYYAQPQNAFWKIMGAVCGAGPELDYADRLAVLERYSIALWDVLAAGQRPGSLDAAIVRSTAVANDFAGFFARHGAVRLICFNGRTAAELYARRIVPGLSASLANIPALRLPSPSPAFAGMRYEQKLEHWSRALGAVLEGPGRRG